jgi:hypothetical protein
VTTVESLPSVTDRNTLNLDASARERGNRGEEVSKTEMEPACSSQSRSSNRRAASPPAPWRPPSPHAQATGRHLPRRRTRRPTRRKEGACRVSLVERSDYAYPFYYFGSPAASVSSWAFELDALALGVRVAVWVDPVLDPVPLF